MNSCPLLRVLMGVTFCDVSFCDSVTKCDSRTWHEYPGERDGLQQNISG